MSDDETELILRAYQERYRQLRKQLFLRAIIIFKNHGSRAGTSLVHPHSQIVATPVVPGMIRAQYEIAVRYYDHKGSSLYADLLAEELEQSKRIVLKAPHFVVFHPYASHHPFETWIMPLKMSASFGSVSKKTLKELAAVLRIVLLKLYRGLKNPDYNLVINSAPIGDENPNYYCWRLRIIPRLTETAGFEIGSGIHINTVFPEDTARFMRELDV
jgi:UDPglucose--hexose-1-phosphate uridylyltransferase